ncbi:hypothetical protein [Frankia sp. QA3]|uniref:hypothetical protein n=1 Tax=Frankia sp. QA3 TaxID=710111 RepID=UPI000269BEFD|nr:hypothetical protein [Frankia sp. QA3]EIV92713.1 hypothetical protein FraQA3DRAFT_2323 [Frankia sp. QA3]
MSVARIEQRLATLLSTPALTVGTGVVTVGGHSIAAAVSVSGVTPRPQFATHLPTELLPRTPQRVSSVTVRAVLSVAAAAGGSGRADALEAATVLWWRCEDAPVATGSGFPADDLTEGYRVVEVRPVGWTTPESSAADERQYHRIDLDVDALVWPRTVAPRAGDTIGPVLIRLSGALAGEEPIRVRPGAQAQIGVDVDLRSLVLHPRAPGDPAPLPREATVTVVPVGDAAAGSVAAATVPLTGDRAVVTYTAGATGGRDELRFTLAPDGAEPLALGAVPVEVVP